MADRITTSDQMLDPQVLADMVSASLTAGLKFTPFVDIDTTLEGKPGTTVEFPTWNYIGDAVDLEEGVAMESKDLTYGSKAATIKEFGTSVAITDQARFSGYGDPMKEAANQISLSMNNKLDNDVLETLRQAEQKKTIDLSLEGLQEALDIYNDENDVAVALVVSPVLAGKIRLMAGKEWLRGSDLGAQTITSGVYGEVLGVQIIRSKKLNANEGILIKPGKEDGKPAVKLMVKRGINMETERKSSERTTVLYANSFEAPYLYNPAKVVNLTFNGVTGPKGTTGAPEDVAVDNTVTNVPEDKRIGKGKKKTTASKASEKPGEA